MVKVLIGGDVCPIGRSTAPFKVGDSKAIFNDLLQDLQNADLTVVNLECCLISKETPILKDGSAFGVPIQCINGIKSAGIDIVNLANNHCLDHGQEGLETTFEACETNNIAYLGAGKNLEEARQILVREVNGLRIGFLGVAEHEFSIVGKNAWGANPLNIIEFIRNIRKHRDSYDFLIVLFHGGKEYYPYPTPNQMEICRFMVEQGAHTVMCQHSHCPGCYEIYENAPIVYGQGNLVFDSPNAQGTWYKGFLVRLNISEDLNCHMDIIPYSQFDDTGCVKRLHGEQEKVLREEINERSRQILKEGFVTSNWIKYCQREKYTYLSRLHGHNRLLRILNRKLHFTDWLYPTEAKLMMRNVVECETHREVLETLWRHPETNSNVPNS